MRLHVQLGRIYIPDICEFCSLNTVHFVAWLAVYSLLKCTDPDYCWKTERTDLRCLFFEKIWTEHFEVHIELSCTERCGNSHLTYCKVNVYDYLHLRHVRSYFQAQNRILIVINGTCKWLPNNCCSEMKNIETLSRSEFLWICIYWCLSWCSSAKIQYDFLLLNCYVKVWGKRLHRGVRLYCYSVTDKKLGRHYH